jgi:hypothetical protein
MQAQQTHIGGERDPAVPILERETADINVLIDEIWLRFTVRAMQMRCSSSGFRIDSLTNQ